MSISNLKLAYQDTGLARHNRHCTTADWSSPTFQSCGIHLEWMALSLDACPASRRWILPKIQNTSIYGWPWLSVGLLSGLSVGTNAFDYFSLQLNQPSLVIRQSIKYHNMARANAHQICPRDMLTPGLRKYVCWLGEALFVCIRCYEIWDVYHA